MNHVIHYICVGVFPSIVLDITELRFRLQIAKETSRISLNKLNGYQLCILELAINTGGIDNLVWFR